MNISFDADGFTGATTIGSKNTKTYHCIAVMVMEAPIPPFQLMWIRQQSPQLLP